MPQARELTPSFKPPCRWRKESLSQHEYFQILCSLNSIPIPSPSARLDARQPFDPNTREQTKGVGQDNPMQSNHQIVASKVSGSGPPATQAARIDLFDGEVSVDISRPAVATAVAARSDATLSKELRFSGSHSEPKKSTAFDRLIRSGQLDSNDDNDDAAPQRWRNPLSPGRGPSGTKVPDVGFPLPTSRSSIGTKVPEVALAPPTARSSIGAVSARDPVELSPPQNPSAPAKLFGIFEKGESRTTEHPLTTAPKPSFSSRPVSMSNLLAQQTRPPPKPRAAAASTARPAQDDETHAVSKKRLRGEPTEESTIAELPSTHIDDFNGVHRVCRNAGATRQGLKHFVDQLRIAPIQDDHSAKPADDSAIVSLVSVGFLFRDLSTNFASHSIKFCNPSARCRHWNCSCDRSIRTRFLRNSLLGAVIAIECDENALPYFLPLCMCVEPDCKRSAFMERPACQLPIQCETTLAERWAVLHSLLYSPSTVKVMYHMQMALLPVMQSLDDWNGSLQSSMDPQSNHQELQKSVLFYRIFDPKIAEYLLNSDVADDELEWHALLSRYKSGDHFPVPKPRGHSSVHELGRISRVIDQLAGELVEGIRLYQLQYECIRKEGLARLLWQVESPTSCLLSSMEWQGVHVDRRQLLLLREQLLSAIAAMEELIYRQSGFEFNILSPEQVSHVLFDKLELDKALPAAPVESGRVAAEDAKNAKQGRFQSTSEEQLKKLVSAHPVVQLILDYRGLQKLLSTYVDGISSFLLEDEPIVHAYWNQTSVRTGRLSCCKPNLQNIPNDEVIAGVPYSIRSVFVSSPKTVFVGADYSQIEMRVLAHVSADDALCQLFRREHGDVYLQLAAKIFGKSADGAQGQLKDQISDSERTQAKVIALGVIYGMGPQAAAVKLNIDVVTAAKITNSFLGSFPQVRQWIAQVKQLAKKLGHVKTIFGRMRQLPDIQLVNDPKKRSAAERQAVNSIIQGSASDLIKFAMTLASDRLSQGSSTCGTSPRLVMQIHDELIFEVPLISAGYLHDAIVCLKRTMEDEIGRLLNIRVPLIANVSVGKVWGQMKDWTADNSSLLCESAVNDS